MHCGNHIAQRDPGFDRFMNFLGSMETDSISITDGNNNGEVPQKPCKRYAMNWSCAKIVDAHDVNSLWSRTFLLHSDWATAIPEFNQLSLQDQSVLFKANYPAFSWMTHAYKCFENGQARVGLPLGNGSYLPYNTYELEKIYGMVCRRIIDQAVIPMFEMNMSFQLYCLLKAFALFQLDVQLSPRGAEICAHLQTKLRKAMAFLMSNLDPVENNRRMEKMTGMISCLMDIGHMEYDNIKTINDEIKC